MAPSAESTPSLTPLALAQRALTIKDVFVRECYARIDESYMPFEGIDDEIGVQTKIQATFHRVVSRELQQDELTEEGPSERNIVEFKILAAARFVSAAASDDDAETSNGDDERFGEVVALFSAVYFMNEAVDEETLIEFGMRNATFHVWPYWRELLHSTTGRLRLPPTVLPMFKIAPIEPKSASEVLQKGDGESELQNIQVDLNERYDVTYWTSAFGVSERVLRDAASRVGSTADVLRAELQRIS